MGAWGVHSDENDDYLDWEGPALISLIVKELNTGCHSPDMVAGALRRFNIVDDLETRILQDVAVFLSEETKVTEEDNPDGWENVDRRKKAVFDELFAVQRELDVRGTGKL
jgi:hypothetical protein